MDKYKIVVNHLTVTSKLGKQIEIGNSVNAKLQEEFRNFECTVNNIGTLCDINDVNKNSSILKKCDMLLVSVATGGTELLMKRILSITNSKKPLLINL